MGDNRVSNNSSDPILGTAELAELLGWDRRKVAVYHGRGHLPKPWAQLASGPIWRRADIDAYLEPSKSKKPLFEVPPQRPYETATPTWFVEPNIPDSLADFVDHVFKQSTNTLMQRAFNLATDLASTSRSLLIQGEPGTGKEALAMFIHITSGDAHGPFYRVNSSSLKEAISGLQRESPLIQGTLFFEDISILLTAEQMDLLTAISIAQPKHPGLRFIVTTSRQVFETDAQIDSGPLFNFSQIEIPPLRTRTEDISRLVAYIASKMGHVYQTPVLTAQAKAALLSHLWPGNIRELQNAIAYAVGLSAGKEIGLQHLPNDIATTNRLRGQKLLKTYVEEAERTLIRWVLADTPHKDEAAQKLGISRAALYKKLNRYGLLSDIE